MDGEAQQLCTVQPVCGLKPITAVGHGPARVSAGRKNMAWPAEADVRAGAVQCRQFWLCGLTWPLRACVWWTAVARAVAAPGHQVCCPLVRVGSLAPNEPAEASVGGACLEPLRPARARRTVGQPGRVAALGPPGSADNWGAMSTTT